MPTEQNDVKALRRQIFVDRQVQGALAMRIIGHWCTFMLLAWLCLWTVEVFLSEPGDGLLRPLGAVWSNYLFFWLLMLSIIPAFAYDTMKLSLRFAGPIFRFRRYLRAVADGESPGPLRFRDGDFWTELAADFNRVVSRIEHLEEEVQLLNQKLARWDATPAAPASVDSGLNATTPMPAESV